MKALALTIPHVIAVLFSGIVNLALISAISASSAPRSPLELRVLQLPTVTVVGKRLPRGVQSTTVAQAPKTVPGATSAKM